MKTGYGEIRYKGSEQKYARASDNRMERIMER